MNTYRRIRFNHVARYFPGVSEFLVIQCFQASDNSFDRPHVGYKNVLFLIASDKEITTATVVVL